MVIEKVVVVVKMDSVLFIMDFFWLSDYFYLILNIVFGGLLGVFFKMF